MNGSNLFRAIGYIDDDIINEAEDFKTVTSTRKIRVISFKRVATVIVISVCVLAASITVLAGFSDGFRSWIDEIFGENNVKKLVASDKNNDENDFLPLKDNLKIVQGDKESFVCEEDENSGAENIKIVYKISGEGLKQLKISKFSGVYDNESYYFEYAQNNNEIIGFNKSDGVLSVFPVMEGDSVYAHLSQSKNDTVVKACFVKINLKTSEVQKITKDNMICNTVAVPGGEKILCNYRSKEYWSVFDLSSGKEIKLQGIDSYAHSDEISFIDENTIFTLTDEYYQTEINNEPGELPVTCLIDLKTGNVIKKIKDSFGDITPEWCYSIGEKTIHIRNIATGLSFDTDKISTDDFYGVSASGNYVLLWINQKNTDEHTVAYIWNTITQKGKFIDASKGMGADVKVYPATSEQKLIISNDKEAFLVDVSGI